MLQGYVGVPLDIWYTRREVKVHGCRGLWPSHPMGKWPMIEAKVSDSH